MPAYYALAVVVGVLAVVADGFSVCRWRTEHHLQVWQAFIAWGCHFHSGGGVKGSRTVVRGHDLRRARRRRLDPARAPARRPGRLRRTGRGRRRRASWICSARRSLGSRSFRPASMVLRPWPVSCCSAACGTIRRTPSAADGCLRPDRRDLRLCVGSGHQRHHQEGLDPFLPPCGNDIGHEARAIRASSLWAASRNSLRPRPYRPCPPPDPLWH